MQIPILPLCYAKQVLKNKAGSGSRPTRTKRASQPRVTFKEAEKVKRLNLIIFFIAVSLTACVSSWHEVNLEGLSSVQNETFHVRSVKIDCNKITEILGKCSADCQLAILNNIPTADITRILSDSYGIKIAQENNLSVYRYRIGDAEEPVARIPVAKVSRGKLKITFTIEDPIDEFIKNLFRDDNVNSSNTCFLLQDETYYPHYIDIRYTVNSKGHPPPFHRGATLFYDIEAVEVIQEQVSIISPPSSSEITLIRHRDEIETFRFDSNNKLDKMRDVAVKIPSVLERDTKAYQLSSKP